MKMSNFFRLLLTFILLFTTRTALAQKMQNVIYYNEPVRITLNAPPNSKMQCLFKGLQNDTLIVELYQKQRLFSLREIKELQVIRGQKSNKGKGALYGSLLGGVGLGFVLVAAVSDDQGEWLTPTPGQAFVAGLIEGGLVGALVGAIVGSGSTSPRWVTVDLKQIQIASKPEPPRQTETEKHPKAVIPATKQKLPEKTQVSLRKLSILVSAGICTGGPAKDIESAMSSNGWDDTSPGGWFSGPTTHPHTNKGGAFSIQATYELNPRFSIGLAFSRSLYGCTYGYRKDICEYLELNFKSTTITPLIMFNPNKLFSIGIGPTWFINNMEHDDADKILYREQKGRLGFSAQFAFRFPQKTRFFVTVEGQYRLVPAATFGPFKTSYRKTNYEELPLFKANFSHGYLGAGFGIRL